MRRGPASFATSASTAQITSTRFDGLSLLVAPITKAGEDERNVAADVAIPMTKPVDERRQHARVVFTGDGLRDLDLFPRNLFVFELFDQRIRSLRGVDSGLRRLAQCYKDEDI